MEYLDSSPFRPSGERDPSIELHSRPLLASSPLDALRTALLTPFPPLPAPGAGASASSSASSSSPPSLFTPSPLGRARAVRSERAGGHAVGHLAGPAGTEAARRVREVLYRTLCGGAQGEAEGKGKGNGEHEEMARFLDLGDAQGEWEWESVLRAPKAEGDGGNEDEDELAHAVQRRAHGRRAARGREGAYPGHEPSRWAANGRLGPPGSGGGAGSSSRGLGVGVVVGGGGALLEPAADRPAAASGTTTASTTALALAAARAVRDADGGWRLHLAQAAVARERERTREGAGDAPQGRRRGMICGKSLARGERCYNCK